MMLSQRNEDEFIEEKDYKELKKDAEMLVLRGAFLDENPAKQSIEDFNEFIEIGLPKIFSINYELNKHFAFPRESDPYLLSIDLHTKFYGIEIDKPFAPRILSGRAQPQLPNEARTNKSTYASPVTVQATVTLTARFRDPTAENEIIKRKIVTEVPRFVVFALPIMIGCKKCNTYGLTSKELSELGETPGDPGGYFVIRGHEILVTYFENISFNEINVWKTGGVGERPLVIKGDVISQPTTGAFSNSSRVLVELRHDGQILIELTSQRFRYNSAFPFYVFFRLLGFTDPQTVASITNNNDSEVDLETQLIIQKLNNAFTIKPSYDKRSLEKFAQLQSIVSRDELAEKMLEILAAAGDFRSMPPEGLKPNELEEDLQRRINDLMNDIDRYLLPHLGTHSSDRPAKLRFLGSVIRKILKVELGNIPPTDRDHYANKRLHGAAYSISKILKTAIGSGLTQPVLQELERLVTTQDFDIIEKNKDAMLSAPFKRASEASADLTKLNKAIENALLNPSSGFSYKGRGERKTVRLKSRELDWRNALNVADGLKGVDKLESSKKSKQTTRAKEMRSVHPSYNRLICSVRSKESGDGVGMKISLACSAIVSQHVEDITLRDKIYKYVRQKKYNLYEVELIPTLHASEFDKFSRVYVNGIWVASAPDTLYLSRLFREKRRKGRIHYQTSIHWDPLSGDLSFRTDIGRVMAPLFIVRNNRQSSENKWETFTPGETGKEFVQGIGLTYNDLKKLQQGRYSVEEMVQEGIVEFISASEAENCLVCGSLEKLNQDKNNILKAYTHCAIETQIYGIAALTVQHPDKTQQSRVTIATIHVRQGASRYTRSAYTKPVTLKSIQHLLQLPIAKTITSTMPFYVPMQMNPIVAIVSDGENQEDSGTFNIGISDRGAYGVSFYRLKSISVESGQTVMIPSPSTKKMKPNTAYTKLGPDGIVPLGTLIEKNDVLVGCVSRLSDENNFEDCSLVYTNDEEAIVDRIIHTSDDGVPSIVISLRSYIPLDKGSKMSSFNANKMIMASARKESDMLRLGDGTPVSMYMNPHGLPSRMTVGQLISAIETLPAVVDGKTVDATAYKPVNPDSLCDYLEENGFRRSGRSTVYDGQTGRPRIASVFVAPMAYMLLQKFAEHDAYTAGEIVKRNHVNHQPVSGGRKKGGLRYGEMENWVTASHGSAHGFGDVLQASDAEFQYVCQCGSDAVANDSRGLRFCTACGSAGKVYKIDGSRTSLIFRQLLMGAGVETKLKLDNPKFPSST